MGWIKGITIFLFNLKLFCLLSFHKRCCPYRLCHVQKLFSANTKKMDWQTWCIMIFLFKYLQGSAFLNFSFEIHNIGLYMTTNGVQTLVWNRIWQKNECDGNVISCLKNAVNNSYDIFSRGKDEIKCSVQLKFINNKIYKSFIKWLTVS